MTLEEYARRYPFSYDALEIPDIGRTVERHYPDPEHKVDAWARRFVERQRDGDTMAILLAHGARRSARSSRYNQRDEMGTQDPLVTLRFRQRHLPGFRAVPDGGCAQPGLRRALRLRLPVRRGPGGRGERVVGGGATHAWAQIYLPGAGWVEFDPTNALVGGRNLIRVAVTRDPSQAIPLSGSFTGAANAFLGMTVEVEIKAEESAG